MRGRRAHLELLVHAARRTQPGVRVDVGLRRDALATSSSVLGSVIIAWAITDSARMSRRFSVGGSRRPACACTWWRTLATAAAAQAPALAQRGAERVVADAEAGGLERAQRRLVGRRRAASSGSGRARDGTAPPCRIPRTGRPNARPRHRCRSAWPRRPMRRRAAPPAPTAASSSGAGGNTARRPISKCDRRDLAHAEVGDRLLHALHAALQAVQRRIDRLQHRRGERHVGLDQRRQRRQVRSSSAISSDRLINGSG